MHRKLKQFVDSTDVFKVIKQNDTLFSLEMIKFIQDSVTTHACNTAVQPPPFAILKYLVTFLFKMLRFSKCKIISHGP